MSDVEKLAEEYVNPAGIKEPPMMVRVQMDRDVEKFKAGHASRESEVQGLKDQLAFTKEYLNPKDTSFRTMIDNFRELTDEQKDKIINLAKSLKDLT